MMCVTSVAFFFAEDGGKLLVGTQNQYYHTDGQIISIRLLLVQLVFVENGYDTSGGFAR